MNTIVDLSEVRRQKEEKAREETLKNMPAPLVEYFRSREIQLELMAKNNINILNFENNILTFSRNNKLTGPEIDYYISMKAANNYALEIIKASDEKIKEVYPHIDIPEIE